MKLHLLLILSFLSLTPAFAESAAAPEPVNKLLGMYRIYYLPFSMEFKEGKTWNDIYPFGPGKAGELNKLLKPEDLQAMDKEYEALRETWKKKSLFLNSPIEPNTKTALTQRLIAHRIPLSLKATDGMGVQEQIEFQKVVSGKSPEVQKALIQYHYFRAFVQKPQEEKFNFFVVGPSWCDSSREYRAILETYAKAFPDPELVLHAVIIDDPKEEIFDSRLLREMFPQNDRYTHENVPKFFAIQTKNGLPQVWEEGEALSELYDRYLRSHRGFYDRKFSLFRGLASEKAAPQSSIDPVLSAATK